MPVIAPLQIAGILQRFISSEKLRHSDAAELIGISQPTLSNFIAGRTTPQEETLGKIQQFLQDQGAMTRFGFPTDVPPPEGAKPTPEDTSILSSLGIENSNKGRHYVCGYLDSWDFAKLVAAISSLPDDQAKRLLGTLCGQTFPSLA